MKIPSLRSGFRLRAHAPLTPAKRLNLPIAGPASTLQVFHFIEMVRALSTRSAEPSYREECMVSLRSGRVLGLAVLLAVSVSGCGGHKPPGINPNPTRVTITPTGSTSLQQGQTIAFTATVQNSSNSNVSAASLVWESSNTQILNISPAGVACAGVFDQTFSVCTPNGSGLVWVTASALGTTSVPTLIFVHPPIDNITVTGILLNNVPIQEPCLSQGQSMTLEAHAFSQGTDITSSVGTFTWSANFPAVVNLQPIVQSVVVNNLSLSIGLNEATATALTPGLTQIYASASGVSSTAFQQPQYQNGQGVSSPVLDFFETCPIQNIKLEVAYEGSGQFTFSTQKGITQNIIATITDAWGNTSLVNTNGGIVLNKIPLVWSGTQTAVVKVPTGCMESCAIQTPLPGAGAVTASCSPPTCNIGFPLSPPILSSPQCAQFFGVTSCQQYIPVPVYAATAISGLVEGAPATPVVLATSSGCGSVPPDICFTSLYDVSLPKGTVGGPNTLPVAPNSMSFDLAGDKAYMGSSFGAQVVSPQNLGTTNPAFTPLNNVTGKLLAISDDGNLAVFSDTAHVPNQVYIANTSTTGSFSTTPLSISGASVAAISPDNLKTFIFGFDGNNNATLYIYSTLQALQAITLPPQTVVNSIVFSTNSAFAYVVQSSNGTSGPGVSVYNTCNNQISTSPAPSLTPQVLPLTASPIVFRALPDGVHFVALESGGSIDYITASITGTPAASLNNLNTSLCPLFVSHTTTNLNLQQGSIHAFNFFPSIDGSLLYVLASDHSSVLVYDLTSNIVTGIPLTGNASPMAADISPDAGTILIAGSDGMLHQISTTVGGSDQQQLKFPNLPNYFNPFCTYNPVSGACTFDTVLVQP